MRVTVIDYKAGNLTSVLKALCHLGAEAEVTDGDLAPIEAAERLIKALPKHLNRCFFLSTGSEATEGASRLMKRKTGKFEIISFQGGFHGRQRLPYRAAIAFDQSKNGAHTVSSTIGKGLGACQVTFYKDCHSRLRAEAPFGAQAPGAFERESSLAFIKPYPR